MEVHFISPLIWVWEADGYFWRVSSLGKCFFRRSVVFIIRPPNGMAIAVEFFRDICGDQDRVARVQAFGHANSIGRSRASASTAGQLITVLIDDAGNLFIADPVCYRDDRTTGAMEHVFARILPRADDL